MSEPTDRGHAPGLDGIRGIAVAAITAYHLGYIDGGILSVTVFFTLSGYLITSILLSSFKKKQAIDLRTFWIRRARRLLPALFLLLVVVLAAARIARPQKLALYGKQALYATFYVANWATIARGDNYFNRFSGPGPFDHLWSLAIEEQFYVVWPLLLLGLLLIGRRIALGRLPLLVVTAALAMLSAWLMAHRYVPSAINNTRAYEGTDCRAAPLLIGAYAAMAWPLDEARRGRRGHRVVLEVAGAVALAIVLYVVLRTDEWSPFLYRGGEPVVALATAVLLFSAAHPRTWIGRALGFAPFRWLGERTYGVYLWHLPVIAFMPATMLATRPVLRGALQIGLIISLAALSFTLVEDPIRRHGIAFKRWVVAAALVPIAAAALVAWPLIAPAAASDLEALAVEARAPAPSYEVHAAPIVAPEPALTLTSCKRVLHIGDSTSLGLISRIYLPDPAHRLEARYRSVGVEVFLGDISGGRSIVERFEDNPSAYEAAESKRSTGFSGCWVFALGISDTATVMGSEEALAKRIDWMMKVADGEPVLWTTYRTLLEKGPYKQPFMDHWNRALVAACARHPNMRVYDWARDVEDGWFLADKIHPNELGSRERAARIAKALAVAFPRQGGQSEGCLVRP